MINIVYSAPAKVILSGEHAVVYGKPAIVAAITLRLNFTLTILEQSGKNDDPVISFIAGKVKEFLTDKKIKFKDKNFRFKINSDIPTGRGLGSSAALSVASSAAFLEFYTGRQFEKEEINNLAYQIEKYFHKNPSGVDPSTVCFGGLVYYRKEFEFLKTISSLNFKIPRTIDKSLYLIDSGQPQESTGQMVESVGKLYTKNPQFIDSIFNDIEKTTKRMVISIEKEDADFFQKCLIDNQILLEMLGTVSNRAKNLLKQLEPYGIGKVTGAGGRKQGSGFILFFANDNNGLEKFCYDKRIKFYKFQQSYKGVKKENES